MKLSFEKLFPLVVLAAILSLPCFCLTNKFHLSTIEMEDVIHIANAINVVNPHLEEGKYLEYAVGIHRAAIRYGVEPTVLVAIAQQETGFRENLPEGKAGEIGIIQIRKMWLKNPKFVNEFRRQSITDLKKPSKSFLFAAWILKGLRGQIQNGTLPYWSYYNSVRFENRFKYFLAVNRNIATLRRFDATDWDSRIIASSAPTAPAAIKVAQLSPPVQIQVQNQIQQPPTVTKDREDEIPSGDRWIPDAIRKIQKQQDASDQANADRRRPSTSLLRTAEELDLASMFSPALQD